MVRPLCVKPDIDGSNLGLFSRNQLRFKPSMGRLIVPNRSSTTSMSDFYMQLLPVAIATSNNCVLPSTLPVDEGIEVAGKRIELSMACRTLVVIENYPPPFLKIVKKNNGVSGYSAIAYCSRNP